MKKLAPRAGRIEPSPTLAITNQAKALRAQGIDVISFGAGEPDFDTPDNIKEAAILALRQGFTKYTPEAGIPELRQAIVEKLKKDNGLDYTIDQIVVSCGAKHSLYNIAQILFEAGDEVIIPAPYWVSYPAQVVLNDAQPIIVATREAEGFKLTPAELKRAITSKTKAVILNSPANPTGAAYTEKELRALCDVIETSDLYLIADEIYEKIVFDGFRCVSPAAVSPTMQARTIVCNGVSKAYAMTGWRMGWTASNKELAKAMATLQGQVTSNINSITQKACIEAYQGSQATITKMVAAFQERRDEIVGRLNAIPEVHCYRPQGAFYVFPRIAAYFGRCWDQGTINNSDDLCDYLLKTAQVALVSGTGFGADGYIRLSYATDLETIHRGLDRIATALQRLKK